MLSKEQIIEALTLAERAGCSLAFQYRVPGGYGHAYPPVENIVSHMLGEINLPSRLTGLTPAEYEEWVALDGFVRCHANTRAGRRCKLAATGGSKSDPQAWKQLNDTKPYCTTHGG